MSWHCINKHLRSLGALLAAGLACKGLAAAPDAAGIEFFETKVRPILAEQCYKCHSHQAEKLKAGLYLDSLEGILAGGEAGPVLVPGDPARSPLIEAIGYENPDLQMPPKTRLPATEIAILTEWVKRGAPGPKSTGSAARGIPPNVDHAEFEQRRQHWAFQPVRPVPPPAVKNAVWPQSPIDRFILAKLEEKALPPAAAADKRTLIRRATFTLVGLPPTSDEVRAFLADESPNAFAKVVDRLLASPRFGERWARHWLDLVRYSETRGHEFDDPIPNAYEYRDYVIRALNADVPYDRFVREHIAGDLLNPPRLHPQEGYNESIIGTAFWSLGECLHSPVDIRQDQADRFDNMVDVMGKTFLGLTVACARCHDHKFDPIRAKDYYSLFGFLQSSHYRLAPFETMENNRQVARDLEKLHTEFAPKIVREYALSARPGVERLAEYLLAGREALAAEPEFGRAKDDLAIEAKSGWKWDGSADGKFFPISKNASSCTVTSKKLKLRHSGVAVRFNPNAKGTAKVLVGKIALEIPRHNRNFPTLLGLRAHQGKEIQIQLVNDDPSEPCVEEIIFTDTVVDKRNAGVELRGSNLSEAFQTRIAAIAQARRLEPNLLIEWTAYLLDAAGNASDPLHPWAKGAEISPAGARSEKERMTDLAAAARAQDAAADEILASAEVVVDYSQRGAEDWFPDGVSFGSAPVQIGEVRLSDDPARPIHAVFEQAAAEFNPIWDKLKPAPGAKNDPGGLGYFRAGRTLATRTFALTSGKLFFLSRGRGHAYAGVGKHNLVAGPLHKALIKKIEPKSRGFEWHFMDLSAYEGQRTHLEFTSESADFAVARVILSDEAPAFPLVHPCVAQILSAGVEDSVSLARGYQRLLTAALARLESGNFTGAEGAIDAGLAHWLASHPELIGASGGKIAQSFMAEQARIIGRIKYESRLTLAMMEGSGEDEYVMTRGSWKNAGDTAPRQLLEVISGENQPRIARGSGRLELAERMVSPSNPFITRVMVNRIWHHLFGQGLVASVDNFGTLGQRDAPVHKELLDFLATDFVRQGWSVKKVIRSLMLSSTYQMASVATAEAAERDPENQLLHRMRLRRLEGEVIRDSILAVSGRLDTKMYGESVPVFLDDFMQGRGRPKTSGPIDGDGRRSIYLGVLRNFISPMMLAFDTPAPFNTMGRRSVSNVPAQALIMMNDPLVQQQAQVWAKRLLAEKSTPGQRVAEMYLAAFARPPSKDETTQALAFVARQRRELDFDAARCSDEEGAWADLAHVLMNSKEFIFVN